MAQNHYWNTIRTRSHWQIKIHYDFFNHLGSYRNIIQFQLVLEGKTGKEIPEPSRLEFLAKFSANNFALSDAEVNTSRSLNRVGIAYLSLLRKLIAIRQKSWEPSFWEVTDSFVSLAYASLAASRTLLQQLLTHLNFTLESKDLSLWYWWKKWFLWTMAAAQAAEIHEDKWGLTWYFLWWLYTLIPTWIDSQNELTAAEAPSLKISFHGTSPKWSRRPSQSASELSEAMQWTWESRCEFYGKLMETEMTTWSEFPNSGKAIVEQILASEEINKCKRAGLWESQSGNPSRKVNHLSKVIWDRKEFTRSEFTEREPHWSREPHLC